MLALQPRIEPATRGFSDVGVFYRRTLALLILSSALTIVLSCANLSGLLLARWSTREGDLAVQAALGASKGRLVSQIVGESLAISIVAVTLSAPVALWSARSLAVLLWNQPDVPPLDLSPDSRVLGVMVVLVGIVALCVSLLPASRIWSGKITLIRGTRGLPGHSVTRWGRWLVAAQVALSVPLLVTAWTVAANLNRLEGANTGFRPDGVFAANLVNQGGVAPTTDRAAYLMALASSLRGVPGIAAAALSRREPVSGIFGDQSRLPITGDDGLSGAKAFAEAVSPGYFETLSVPLVAGRDFSWIDNRGQRDVAIISAGLARAVFSGANPVGRIVRLGGRRPRSLDVIGVVADAKLAEPHQLNQLFLFTALMQEPPRFLEVQSPEVLLKSQLPPGTVEASVRRAIVGLGQDEIFEFHSLQHSMDAVLLRERLMRLGGLYFAGLTALLVFVGLHAALNLGIARRVPEIGLRIALGATTHDIRRLVIREALATTTAGLIVGIPSAFLSGRLIASTLTLAGPHEGLAFAAAVVLILTVTALSALMPLRRASRITPVEALSSQ
jgi:predicted permease